MHSSEARMEQQKMEARRFTEQFGREVVGITERYAEHQERAVQADRVILVCGCDDSRVGVPAELQTMPDGSKALMIFVSAIGGGAPDRELLESVLSEVESWGVTPDKMEILTTQHGSTKEVGLVADHDHSAEDCISCGLRKVLQSAEKGATPAIPQRLLVRATAINTSSSMEANGKAVAEKIAQYELGVPLRRGYFDHQGKTISVVSPEGEISEVVALEYEKWEPAHQDPEGLVVSFGAKTNAIHDGIVLPESIGTGKSNDFSASALATEDDFLNAFAEIWYAASHHADHVAGHGHDLNFANTKFCAVICDNQAYVDRAKEAMKTAEFQTTYAPVVKDLGGIQLINMQDETAELFPL